MAQNCPEKCDALYTQKFEIYQSDFDNTEHIKTLVPQSWNATALDSGTTKTVAGKGWCSCYINSLNEENKKKKIHQIRQQIHIDLGDEKLFPVLNNVHIPVLLSNQNVMLNTDIVANDITLLLS